MHTDACHLCGGTGLYETRNALIPGTTTTVTCPATETHPDQH